MPGIEPGLPTTSLLNYKKKNLHGIWTLAACIRVEDFATGSEIDNNKLLKAVLDKIPGKGTNLGSSEWN